VNQTINKRHGLCQTLQQHREALAAQSEQLAAQSAELAAKIAELAALKVTRVL
jgi:hypothetical protein